MGFLCLCAIALTCCVGYAILGIRKRSRAFIPASAAMIVVVLAASSAIINACARLGCKISSEWRVAGQGFYEIA
jgi:hypothetical protein